MCAAYKAVKSGYQAAIMAPTAILASQHLENFKKIYELRNELVKIMTDESIVNIKGNNLYVEYMNDSDIKIIGNLSEVKLSEV